MSEDDSRGEEEMAEEETDSGDKADEATKEDEGKDDEDSQEDEPPPPKKRGRKPGSGASPAKKAKKEKGAEGATKKKRKPVKKHPKTIDMVVEAIDTLAENKGSSVQVIKAYILQHFKTVRTDMVKSMLRRALTMGLQQSILARPKGQTDTQVMSGRYLLGKSATMEDEDEVMPKQSKRAQEAMKSAMMLKKKGRKGKKSAKRPVARKVSSPKRPVKKTKRGRK